MTDVLIVDDSKTARMMLRHWIGQVRPDYRVVEAEDGTSAMAAAATLELPFFAILDYNMPGLRGVEIAEQLAQYVDLRRIALCTANIQEAIQKRAEDMGLRYVTKPLSPPKVKALLELMESSL